MKSNVVHFPGDQAKAVTRLVLTERAERRAMGGIHCTCKRWFYAGAVWGVVLASLTFILIMERT